MKVNTITKEAILREIAKDVKSDVPTIRKFYNCLEDIVFDYLSDVNADNEVVIKLFKGISIDGVFVNDCKNDNVCMGKKVEPMIKPKISVTRYYRDKLNNKR